MSKTTRIPSYRRHKPSNRAVVTLNGTDHYLGKWNSKESKEKYNRLIAEWLAADCQAPVERETYTVVELIRDFQRHAKKHYRRNGEATGAADNFKWALRPLKELYGRTPVDDFGPLSLKAVRQRMMEQEHSRTYINGNIGKIKTVFRWGVAEGKVSASTWEALHAVRALEAGRTEARESDPVEPVPEEQVDAVLPHLPHCIRDMIRLQRLTGARPGEVCNMRPCDLDRTKPVWAFEPPAHKTAHKGKKRIVLLGPRAQQIIGPYLLEAEPDEYLFSPKRSEQLRHIDQRRRRKTRVQPSQQGDARRRRNPKRQAGEKYTTTSYRRAIHRACVKAGIPTWGPNRLRHSMATAIRKEADIETVSTLLGHSTLSTSEIYAERDLELAAEVVAKVG